MSTPYGPGPGQPSYGQPPYGQQPYGQPANSRPGGFSFGWLSESFQLFTESAGVWIVLTILVFMTGFIWGIVLNVIFPPAPVGTGVIPPGTNPFAIGFQRGFTGGSLPHFAVQEGSSILIGAFFSACAYNLALIQVRGEQIGFHNMFEGARNVVQMVIFAILQAIAIVIGFIGICVGSFVVFGLLLPTGAIIADGDNAIDAMSKSISMMKNAWLPATGLVLVFSLIYLVSIIPCCLGLLVTYPMIYLISALAYRDMAANQGPSGGFQTGATGNPGAWPPPPVQPYGQWPPSGPSTGGQWPSQGPPPGQQWPSQGPSPGEQWPPAGPDNPPNT